MNSSHRNDKPPAKPTNAEVNCLRKRYAGDNLALLTTLRSGPWQFADLPWGIER
jgi:hypothetical protein